MNGELHLTAGASAVLDAVANPPASGMVRVIADTGERLTLILTGDPDRGGDVGGWQASERVLRPDADWWKSTPKGTVSLPCLVDIDAIGGPSVERRLEVLYAMGAPVDGPDGFQPPGLWLFGDVPTCRGRRWKLDDVKLGGRLFRPDAPKELRRQEVTLELSSLDVAEPIAAATIKRTRTSGGARRRRTIIVRQGDTMRAIAVRQLGTSGQWTKLRDWNPKLKRVDPDAPLRTGTHLVLH